MTNSFYNNAGGKLLITGEYLVMEGAEAFAVPLNKGQSLNVKTSPANTLPKLVWNARIPSGLWFDAEFLLPSLKIIKTSDSRKASALIKILETVRDVNPLFLTKHENVVVDTVLDFPPQYGFGSSSTLITNIARWAGVDPFELQFKTLGGSAYDIACAVSGTPVIYKLDKGVPRYKSIAFNPGFKNNLFFVYLGKKQSSAQGIKYFKENSRFSALDIDTVTKITREMVAAGDLDTFSKLMDEHEKLMSKILGLQKVKDLYFTDIEGSVKSLGAWGGDFVLFATKIEHEKFIDKLKTKGFSVIFAWHNLVKNP